MPSKVAKNEKKNFFQQKYALVPLKNTMNLKIF